MKALQVGGFVWAAGWFLVLFVMVVVTLGAGGENPLKPAAEIRVVAKGAIVLTQCGLIGPLIGVGLLVGMAATAVIELRIIRASSIRQENSRRFAS